MVPILYPLCEPWASGKTNGLKKPWWQTSGGTQESTKNESKSHKKSLKIGSGTIPGALRGDSGTILAPGRPKAQQGTKRPRNPSPFLAPKWRPGPTLRGLVF